MDIPMKSTEKHFLKMIWVLRFKIALTIELLQGTRKLFEHIWVNLEVIIS